MLKTAVADKNTDKIQYHLALVEGRVKSLEKVDVVTLTDVVKIRLESCLKEARAKSKIRSVCSHSARGLKISTL